MKKRGLIGLVFISLILVVLLSIEIVSACTIAAGTPRCYGDNTNCPAGEYCNFFCDICMPGCRDDSECPLGQVCTGGFFERECADSCTDDCTR